MGNPIGWLRNRKVLGPFRRNRWAKVAAAVLVLAAVFSAGMGVGSGRVRVSVFGSDPTQNQQLPAVLNYSSVTDLYEVLKENYDGKLTASQLVDGLKKGLAEATNDPYTEYFDAADAKAFDQELNNSFSGIGAELGKDANGNLIIVAPLKGYPADRAGLKPQDAIASIDGETTAGMSIDSAVAKIRGEQGSKVTLAIVRDSTQALTFTIVRDNIQLPSVTSKTLDGNIGYIQISSFADDTADLATKAAQSFADAHAKGIILDLRGDPGGRLDAAINVSSLWLPSGKTILTEKGTSDNQTYTATGANPLAGIPTVVLIDSGSASASEITAGALHDNGVARLIGEKSYGKGVVQRLIGLSDGGELKVTTASWYRPDGQNINKKGITPDQVVPLSDADAKAGNDTQLQAAEAYLNK